jgi:hypothetical protein
VAAGHGRVLGHGDDGEVYVGPLLDHGPAVLEGGIAVLERGVLVAPDVAVPLDVVAQLGQPPEDVLVEDAGALGVVGGYPGQCVTVRTVPGAGDPSTMRLGCPSSSWYGTNFTASSLASASFARTQVEAAGDTSAVEPPT